MANTLPAFASTPMPTPSASWPRVRPCLAILATVAITVLVVTVPAWYLGRRFEDERHFLKTFRTPYDSEAFFTYCADYAATSAERNDVVFVGGSTCLSGVRTEQFEECTGSSAYNLGTIGMLGSEGYYLILKSYLEHHPAPRLAVLCVSPREVGPWRVRREPINREIPARAGSVAERFYWCYGQAGAYPRPAHSAALKYYVSQGLLMTLGDFCGGENHYLNKPTQDLQGFSYNNLKGKVSDDRGFYSLGGTKTLPSTARSDPASDQLLPAAGATADDPYPVLPEFDDGVRKLAHIAADKDVLLMIRLSPELVGTDPDQCGRIRAWFEQLESDCPNVFCDRPEILLYGPEYFSDEYSHLNLRGAERFTELVAARVIHLLNAVAETGTSTSASEQSTAIPKGQAE